ncbi:MAG TPA: class I SAM-dependent methyltransferase [Kiritimatiellia bacterium]|nr:class I SAM-dependent methyltransferase [Kiritimatiellia bacterium]
MENNPREDPRIAFFDSIAGAWDGWHDLAALAKRLDAEFEGFGIRASETVLDVGCGTGNLTLSLLNRLGSGGRVIALDISQAMLDRAQQKIRDPRVTWIRASAGLIPVADASCDRIICFSVWPHFGDPAAVVREFRRVLRADGSVHILHLISREEVNRIHGQGDPSIRDDQLKPVQETAGLFERDGFTLVATADGSDRYLVTVRKGS